MARVAGKPFDELFDEMMQDPEFRAEYEALQAEYEAELAKLKEQTTNNVYNVLFSPVGASPDVAWAY